MLELWLESFRDRLLSLSARVEATLPVKCEAWSHTLGECTAFDGYTAGVKCQLLNPRPGKSDALVLELRLRAMRGEPVVEKFELAWNDFKAEKFKSPVRKPQTVTQQLLDELDAFFPRFESMARQAISQGVKERQNCMMIVGSTISEDADHRVEAEAEELAVVQSCFNELFGCMEGEPLFLSPTMAFPGGDLLATSVMEALAGLQLETLEDFRRRSRQWASFPEGFALNGRPTVLGEPEIEWEDGYRRFYCRYPRAPGIFHFSRPGINNARNQALVLANRNDGLYSRARAENDPTLSSHFSQLCLLELGDSGWKVKARGEWFSLVDHDRMRESGAEFAKQKLADDLSAAGWEIEESEAERLRLRSSKGRWLTVITQNYLSARLIAYIGQEPEQEFYICKDPVLIVPFIQPDVILANLK